MFSGHNQLTIWVAIATALVLAGLGALFLITPKSPSTTKDTAKERQQLLAGLRSGKPEVRARAAAQLGKHRPVAKETVAALVLSLSDPDLVVQTNAATSLADIGPLLADRPEWAELAVGPAIHGLDDSAKIALPLEQFLGDIGPAGKPAIPALRRYANFKGLKQRTAAIHALIKLDPEHAEDLLPGVMGLLDEADPEMRGEGLVALSKIGEKGKPATPRVIALLDGDPEPGIRLDAAQALLTINPSESARVVPGLVALIKDIDEKTNGQLKPQTGSGGRITPDLAGMAHPLKQPRTAALALLFTLDPKAAESLKPVK